MWRQRRAAGERARASRGGSIRTALGDGLLEERMEHGRKGMRTSRTSGPQGRGRGGRGGTVEEIGVRRQVTADREDDKDGGD